MKLILIQNVDKLGAKGDEVLVKDGYGRNYLIPNGLAVSMSDPRAKQLANEMSAQKNSKEEEIKSKRLEAEKINGKIIILKEKASKSKLFAAISKAEIAKELGVTADNVKLDEPIKELGEHKIAIEFGDGISAEIIINVEKA